MIYTYTFYYHGSLSTALVDWTSSAVYAIVVCLSVRLSVTSRYRIPKRLT